MHLTRRTPGSIIGDVERRNGQRRLLSEGLMKRLLGYFWKDKVFVVAFVAAVFSMFLIPPSLGYLGYFKTKVLVCMFGLMIAVGGMYEQNFFTVVAIKLVKRFHSVRNIALVIVLTTFTLGMLITNDAVLLTLVPFSIFVMKEIRQEKHLLGVVILQTIAANLGSAMTPMGDPQNIYLFTRFSIPFFIFLKSMLPVTMTGLFLIVATTLAAFPKTEVEPIKQVAYLNDRRIYVYFLIFAIAILCILGVLGDLVTLIIVMILSLMFGRTLFKRVDYPLLLTFSAFFVFTGNISQIGSIASVMTSFLQSPTSVYFMGLVTSQFISNVPAAVLLSSFTPENYIVNLLQGVNVGAMGTIIASLASLIAFKFVLKDFPGRSGEYLWKYTLVCIVYIAIITLVVFFV